MSAVADPSDVALRRLVIVGNPNCGKTTLFNALTGLRQKVANYPGVTVEKKSGRFFGSHGEPMELVDLPGSYSLQARSPDEAISRDVLLGFRSDTLQPDAVICVVDASNLGRNLYLVAQIMELGLPVIVALNMVDIAEAKGIVIDLNALRKALGVPVIRTVATKRVGLVELKQALSHSQLTTPKKTASLPSAIEHEAQQVAGQLIAVHGLSIEVARAQALLLLALSGRTAIAEAAGSEIIADEVAAAAERLRTAGHEPAADPVEARYTWVQSICERAARAGDASPKFGQLTISDRIDFVLTHRIWGWLFFVALMATMFFCIFTLAQIPMDWIKDGVQGIGNLVEKLLPESDSRSLLVNGIISGVGAVVTFLPQILILFFFIGLLEDTGYLPRAAFIIDRVMTKVGLHGKSFIPLLSCFACTIPGIMAARTIENRKDRLTTILIAPLMSCSARLPVYALLIAAMFPSSVVNVWQKAGIMLAMYFLGMGTAFCAAWMFKKSLLKGETPMLILELPPYRFPSLKWIFLQMIQRARLFLRRCGTIILGVSVVLWALATYPKKPEPNSTGSERIAYSLAGRIGHLAEPMIKPLGFDWKIGICLVSSFAAREVFVGTMGVLYSVEGEGQEETNVNKLRDAMVGEKWPDGAPVFTPRVCLALMVFYVLALQCMSTIAIVRRETNSWKWPAFQLVYLNTLAYIGALVVYQGAGLLGLA
jgi:ferrous iron transport protein B